MGEVEEAASQNPRSAHHQEFDRLAPLGSNDDELERAQARAAARRRRSSLSLLYAQAAAAAYQATGEGNVKSDVMDRDQILDLYQNCIRLASENKINQKNTWELGLIDHLSEVIKVDEEEDTETNFQKASCTLEAGVKIYSLRVDSVHAEAYKVLGGINRAGRDDEEGVLEANEDSAHTAGEEGRSKKETERKVSPVSTLESSFEALNVKKFDVAFTVDPLYHQTTAQFDEGGAKGLLLYNLGVYGGCRVLFDSFEVPERCGLTETPNCKNATIDLSFAKESIENMMLHMPNAKEISPTLRLIIEQFDEENQRPPSEDVSPLDQAPVFTEESIDGDASNTDMGSGISGDGFAECGPSWDYDNGNDNFNYDDDRESVVDESTFPSSADSTCYQEGDGECMNQDMHDDEKLERITDFLSVSLGFSSKNNAWAGPDHWKFRKIKGPVSNADLAGNPETAPKRSKSKRGLPDIDFTKSVDKHVVASLFAPPKNPKSLLLPASRAACSNMLPEDCHYRPDSLVKLFLLPDTMCLGRKGRKSSGGQREDDNYDDFESPPSSWDHDDVMSDNGHDFGNNYNVDEAGSLLRKPRQVNKIDVKYDKVSKQVDVHALKDMLWGHIQESVEDVETKKEEENKEKKEEEENEEEEENNATVTLSGILHQFPNESPKDISPHLFFICLLHLANEHGLALYDRPTLDEIDIVIPSSSLLT